MSDVTCLACSEPWDIYHLRHDAIHETSANESQLSNWQGKLTDEYRKLFAADDWQFGASIYTIKRCPCCPDDAVADQAKLTAHNVLAFHLGDDDDGMIAMLQDFELV